MGLGLRLEMRQSQQLVMTPQLQQAIRLLQMSNLELCDFVDQEVQQNPLLEIDEGGSRAAAPAPDADAPLDQRVTAEGDPGLAAETFDTGAENLYDPEPGTWSGVGAGGSAGFDGGEDDLDQRLGEVPSLRDHLLGQLGQGPEPREVVARHLVDELDEHGFLRSDPAEIALSLGCAVALVEQALARVQACEPTGVGARNLAECLALQLAEADRLDPAMRALIDHLDLLPRGELRRLRLICGVDEDDFAAMLGELRALDPRPCARFATERAETLIPDVFLRRAPWGGWQIELNTETLPRVLVTNRYQAALGAGDEGARAYLAEARANASWLVKSLDQRARTILKVATEVVRQQERFFDIGIAGLKPLNLRMVAEAVGMHESTASRVTSNKYIATPRGIFELKFFFTNAIGGDGEDGSGVSASTVRHRIKCMIEAEGPDDVLSDDTIVDILRAEGIDIARRTVAKYRKGLGIPSSVDRRRQKTIAGVG